MRFRFKKSALNEMFMSCNFLNFKDGFKKTLSMIAQTRRPKFCNYTSFKIFKKSFVLLFPRSKSTICTYTILKMCINPMIFFFISLKLWTWTTIDGGFLDLEPPRSHHSHGLTSFSRKTISNLNLHLQSILDPKILCNQKTTIEVFHKLRQTIATMMLTLQYDV